jgi:hypothetical protein
VQAACNTELGGRLRRIQLYQFKLTGRLIETPRDDFMLVAERELIAFERKERELRRQERLDRVKEKFPALINVLQS